MALSLCAYVQRENLRATYWPTAHSFSTAGDPLHGQGAEMLAIMQSCFFKSTFRALLALTDVAQYFTPYRAVRHTSNPSLATWQPCCFGQSLSTF